MAVAGARADETNILSIRGVKLLTAGISEDEFGVPTFVPSRRVLEYHRVQKD